MRVTSFGLCSSLFRAFPGGSDGKDSACNAGEPRSAPGLGRSLGAGNGNPFQYSCQENSLVSSEITRIFQRVLGAFMTPCPLDISVLIQHHGSSMKGKENNSSHGNELKPLLRSINHDTTLEKQANLELQPHHSVWDSWRPHVVCCGPGNAHGFATEL